MYIEVYMAGLTLLHTRACEGNKPVTQAGERGAKHENSTDCEQREGKGSFPPPPTAKPRLLLFGARVRGERS